MSYSSSMDQIRRLFKDKDEEKAKLFNEIAEALEQQEDDFLSDDKLKLFNIVLSECEKIRVFSDEDCDRCDFHYRVDNYGTIKNVGDRDDNTASELLAAMVYCFTENNVLLEFVAEDGSRWGYYIVPEKGIFDTEETWMFVDPTTNRRKEVDL